MKDSSIGIVFTVMILTAAVLVFFAGPPIAHLYDRWTGYWGNDSREYVTSPSLDATAFNIRTDRLMKANGDCETRTQDYFKVPKISMAAYASSTSPVDVNGQNTYATYDCYGVKFTKLP